jgi:hypothetical protein
MYIAIATAVGAGIVATVINYTASSRNQATPTVCPQDALVCPNGTTVSRTGPNCEFQCPE